VFVAFILAVSPKWSPAELRARFAQCTDVGEKLRCQAVMLEKEGRPAREIASICGRNEDWVRRTVRKFNEHGADALADGRRRNGRAPMLDEQGQEALRDAIEGPAPDGGLWTSQKVADWISARLEVPVDEHTGWAYLRRLGFSRQTPRPKHPDADPEAQEAFKKGGFAIAWETSFENTPRRTSRSGRKTKGASD
jgi:transposase